MASTSTQLSSEAGELQTAMSFFKLDGNVSSMGTRTTVQEVRPSIPAASSTRPASAPAPKPIPQATPTETGGLDLDMGDDGDEEFERF